MTDDLGDLLRRLRDVAMHNERRDGPLERAELETLVAEAGDVLEIIPDLVAALQIVMQHGRIDDSEARMNQVAAALVKAGAQ